MRFWDASAVVPAVVDEPRSQAVRGLLADDPDVALWWATRVECAAAIARRRREGVASTEQEAAAVRDLDDFVRGAEEVVASAAVRDHAVRLVRTHPLRAGDALQLAAALVWAEGAPTGRELVSFDERLREAAAREGFRVLP